MSKSMDAGNRGSDGVASPIKRPPLLNITVPRLRDIKPPYKGSIERPIDIVLLTVKDVEFLNCYAVLTNVYYSNFQSLGKVYFGEIASEDGISKVKVALLRCGESAGAARGSLNVTSNAIVSLAPKAVICAGFCGGINPGRAKLGDVVISTTLSTYNNDITTDVTRHMGVLTFTVAHGWDPPLEDPDIYDVEVHTDRAVLSGPELVNDEARRKQLLEKYPMAVAIEMEGEGINFNIYNCVPSISFVLLFYIPVYEIITDYKSSEVSRKY